MTEQHPITPPPELVKQWWDEALGQPTYFIAGEVATRAAQWGADQELDACCEWLQDPDLNVDTCKLRAARRPKPPSLKQQALEALSEMEDECLMVTHSATIRRALEQLDD